MIKVEAVVIRERVETVIDAVEDEKGHVGVTVVEAIGHGRERGITHEYLERLTEAFRSYFHSYTEAPLLVVNCSDIDFVEHGGDLADLIKEIRASKLGVQHYIPLGSR